MSRSRRSRRDSDGYLHIIPYCCLCERMEDEVSLLRFVCRNPARNDQIWYCYQCHVNREPAEVLNFLKIYRLAE